ncbi:HNH endonuclease [Pantoea phage Nafs113]|nr:HNH endonuclease [Pantoea phage Nafs113]
MSQSFVFFFNGPWPDGFREWQNGDKEKPIVDKNTGVAVMYSHYFKGYKKEYRYFHRTAAGGWQALGFKYTPFGYGTYHWRCVDSPVSDAVLERRFQDAIGNTPKPLTKKGNRKANREARIQRTIDLGLIPAPAPEPVPAPVVIPPASEEAKAFAAAAEAEEERAHQYTQTEIRQNQRKFREVVFDNCYRRCVVTGLMVVLEAAHLVPFADGGVDTFDNGLLMRVDIHRLFDAGFMAINPQDMTVHFSTAGYSEYEGRVISTRRPVNPAFLAARWEAFNKRNAAA